MRPARDPTFVGRIRADPTVPTATAWRCSCRDDNLRKGAALNAVQIAEAPSAAAGGRLFYTGLVADLDVLCSARRRPTPSRTPVFVAAVGEPAGSSSAADTASRCSRCAGARPRRGGARLLAGHARALCRRAAADAGIEVVLHESPMETMDLGRRYRSIYLAGPTFNLLPDDDTAGAALARIAAHLEPGGSVLLPLFIPQPSDVGAIGVTREAVDDEGAGPPVHALGGVARRGRAVCSGPDCATSGATKWSNALWTLHWHTQDGFRDLAEDAGLVATAVIDPAGGAAAADASMFVFLLTR